MADVKNREIDLARLLRNQNGQAININYVRTCPMFSSDCTMLYADYAVASADWQQMLEAVQTIHEERVVHSDLKPANFMFVRGCLKLIDFGIAAAIQSWCHWSFRKTRR